MNNETMYVKEVNDCERLYSLDVLGVEDRGEDEQQVVYSEFKDHPWIPGTEKQTKGHTGSGC